MSEGTEFVRMSADEFRTLNATGQMPKRGSAHPKGTRCEEDGISFDSKTERDFYRHLRDRGTPGHIDDHTYFRLPGGIRYCADFTVSYMAPGGIVADVYDVKGRKPGTDFWRLKKLFDATHPLAPLRVVRREGKGWREVESARDWT